MIITYHGGQFVKFSQGDAVIASNPFGKNSTFKQIRFGARIGLVSANHPDMNGVENLSHGDKTPFAISGPGEYEVGGISISGFTSPKPFGEDGLINTIYAVEMEGIRLCILGGLSSAELSSDLIEGIGEVDILIVPIAGKGILSPGEAGKVSVMLGAKLVIPVGWASKDDNELKSFLKEMGSGTASPAEKITLKKKDLDGKEGEVVVLEPLTHA